MNVIAYHYWSPTCNPCKVIKPAIEDLKREFLNVSWVSINTHDGNSQELCSKFNVTMVPTIVVTVQDKDGKIITSEKNSGTTMASYYRMIRNALRYVTTPQS
jgi:thiol-disulfide isomerase/thioredoxin